MTSNSLLSNGSAPAVKSESRPSYTGKRPPSSVRWFSDTSFDMTSLYPPFGVGSGQMVTCNETNHRKHGNTRQRRSARSDQTNNNEEWTRSRESAAGTYVVVVQALVDEAGEEAVGPDDARRPRGAVPGARREHGLGAADVDAERLELLQ